MKFAVSVTRRFHAGAWRHALAGLLLAWAAGGLTGCATPAAPKSEPTADMTTESDEPLARKRARTRLELAVSYFEQDKTQIALDEVKQSLAQDPAYAPALSLRGLIYMRLDNPRLAEDSFKQALQVQPDDGDVLHNLGWLQCQQARYTEALATFDRALALRGYRGKAKTWMTKGLCEQQAGKLADAEASLQHSYELEPGNPVTGYNLANLLQRRGDLTRAQFHARRLNNSPMANAESLWLGIRIERRMGQADAAQQLGSQLLKRFGGSREAQLYEKGQFDE